MQHERVVLFSTYATVVGIGHTVPAPIEKLPDDGESLRPTQGGLPRLTTTP